MRPPSSYKELFKYIKEAKDITPLKDSPLLRECFIAYGREVVSGVSYNCITKCETEEGARILADELEAIRHTLIPVPTVCKAPKLTPTEQKLQGVATSIVRGIPKEYRRDMNGLVMRAVFDAFRSAGGDRAMDYEQEFMDKVRANCIANLNTKRSGLTINVTDFYTTSS